MQNQFIKTRKTYVFYFKKSIPKIKAYRGIFVF